jgi:hypothetical protein
MTIFKIICVAAFVVSDVQAVVLRRHGNYQAADSEGDSIISSVAHPTAPTSLLQPTVASAQPGDESPVNEESLLAKLRAIMQIDDEILWTNFVQDFKFIRDAIRCVLLAHEIPLDEEQKHDVKHDVVKLLEQFPWAKYFPSFASKIVNEIIPNVVTNIGSLDALEGYLSVPSALEHQHEKTSALEQKHASSFLQIKVGESVFLYGLYILIPMLLGCLANLKPHFR